MGYGYSQNLVRTNKAASIKSLGVALGRVCIERDISVREIALAFGVSRMTIYNWFKGESIPKRSLENAIQRYIHTASKKK